MAVSEPEAGGRGAPSPAPDHRAAARRRRARSIAGTLLSLLLTMLGLLLVTFIIGRVMPIDPVLASKGDILRAIADIYGFKRTLAKAADDFSANPGNTAQVSNFEQLVTLSGRQELDAADQPVVQAVDVPAFWVVREEADVPPDAPAPTRTRPGRRP